MRLLVTGGAGFIGSNFIHHWLKNHPKDEIVNFDKLTYAGNLENLKGIENSPNYSFVKGDIAEASDVEKVMKGIDTVVHFAAESHVDRSIMGPAEFVRTNVVGTQVLLDSALKYKVKRFHHVSTDEVYGDVSLDSDEKFTEERPFRPNSPYAASKAASDHLVRAYHRTYDLPVSVTNCSNNYGPYQFPEKFFGLSITNLLENKKIPVYGKGINMRDWLFVEDHCRAIDLVISDDKTFGKYYNVGGGEERQNIEVAKQIVAIMGQGEDMIEFVKDRPGHDLRYPIDDTKIRDELGYKPLVDFEEGLKRTIDWYRENESWWKPLKVKNKDYFDKQSKGNK